MDQIESLVAAFTQGKSRMSDVLKEVENIPCEEEGQLDFSESSIETPYIEVTLKEDDIQQYSQLSFENLESIPEFSSNQPDDKPSGKKWIGDASPAPVPN